MFRNMTIGKTILVILAIIFCIDVYVLNTAFNGRLGVNEELYCYIDDGYVRVDKDKIISYEESTGYWIFTNGYAKNCFIMKKDD